MANSDIVTIIAICAGIWLFHRLSVDLPEKINWPIMAVSRMMSVGFVLLGLGIALNSAQAEMTPIAGVVSLLETSYSVVLVFTLMLIAWFFIMALIRTSNWALRITSKKKKGGDIEVHQL